MKRWVPIRRKRRIVAVGLAVLVGMVVLEAPAIPILTSSLDAKLYFSDNFKGTSLDGSKWNTFVTSRAANGQAWNDLRPYAAGNGSSVGCKYTAQYYLSSQVGIDNGLMMTATRSYTPGLCNQAASLSTFPWRSGAVSTYNHFQFDGGYMMIKMKAPSGNGMWPSLWMLPGPGGAHGDDFEIDLQEGGYDPGGQANETYAWHLHHGSTTWGGTVNTGIDLSSGYHTYALNWIPGQSITWYLDGQEVAKLVSTQASIPNEPMELIMDLAVANANASSWHRPYDSTTSSPSVMRVASVQVWSAPPS